MIKTKYPIYIQLSTSCDYTLKYKRFLKTSAIVCPLQDESSLFLISSSTKPCSYNKPAHFVPGDTLFYIVVIRKNRRYRERIASRRFSENPVVLMCFTINDHAFYVYFYVILMSKP